MENNELVYLEKVNNEIVLQPEIAQQIAYFEKKVKELKDAEENLKANILKEMEANGVYKLDTSILSITYVAEYLKDTFDTKKLKEEDKETYYKYIKSSIVKASVRIKVKDGAMED